MRPPGGVGAGLLLAAVLTVAVAAARLWLASRSTHCGVTDPCVYLSLARSLAAGQGYHLPFAWTWLTGVEALPHPAIDYWRPGTSYALLAAAPFAEVTLFSGAVVLEGLSVGLALAAAYAARAVTRDRTTALFAYLVAFSLSPLWWAHLTPDSMIPYGVLVGWFLALMADPDRGPGRTALALLLAAAAYLTRNDAAILVVPLALSAARAVLRRRRAGDRGASSLAPALAVPAFVLALVPAHLLNAAVLGSADSGGLRIALFMTELTQFQWYGQVPGPDTALAGGWTQAAAFRLEALATIVLRIMRLVDQPATFVAAMGAVLLLARPGSVRNAGGLVPAAGFLLAAGLAYAVLFPGIGTHAILRTHFGFLPTLAVLAAVALRGVAAAPRRAAAGLALLLLFSTADGLAHARRMLAAEAHDRGRMLGVAETIAATPAGPPKVLIDDPAQFYAATGLAALPLPSNGVPAMVRAALDHRVTHVVAPRAFASELSAALGAGYLEAPGTDLVVLPLRLP